MAPMSLPTPTNNEGRNPQAQKEAPLLVLSGETNIESIRDLEEQIREHEKIIIKLKRSRNSLLNVYKLPPEVLGDIFRRNVTLKDDFEELGEGSRNFLLVSHHWFEVALRTPEVWSFWGSTPADWARWHRRSGSGPLDLVLHCVHHDSDILSVTLRDALQDRAVRDAIRRVHLLSASAPFLSSIISSFTIAREGVRSNSVESFILFNDDDTPVDTSDFFAHYRFPKLRRLKLYNCSIASWDLLTSRTTVLTTLILRLNYPSPTPTTSQLLSILASNPTLQTISFSGSAIPDDGGGRSPSRVPLHNLKELKLDGGLQHIIGLLHRFDHPANMDKLDIIVRESAVAGISRNIGPYLRDYLRRRDRSQNGLGLSISRPGWGFIFRAGDVGAIDPPTSVWSQVTTFVEITMELDEISHDAWEEGVLGLIPYTPRDDIICFRLLGAPLSIQDISAKLPNLRALQFGAISLPPVFQEPNLDGNRKLLPYLQHIFAEQVAVGSDGWNLLAAFLAHRASSGNPLSSLTIVDSPHMCLPEKEHLRGVVRELRVDRLGKACPFHHEYCQERELPDQ